VGECFFWHWLTWDVPDKVKRGKMVGLSVCVLQPTLAIILSGLTYDNHNNNLLTSATTKLHLLFFSPQALTDGWLVG